MKKEMKTNEMHEDNTNKYLTVNNCVVDFRHTPHTYQLCVCICSMALLASLIYPVRK